MLYDINFFYIDDALNVTHTVLGHSIEVGADLHLIGAISAKFPTFPCIFLARRERDPGHLSRPRIPKQPRSARRAL